MHGFIPNFTMQAMILAAGLGTRLRPLTNDRPKALVEVIDGVPMLGQVARRLIDAGATRLIVNVHHFSDQIKRYLEAEDHFGVEVFLSEEPERPLETGGGLLAARPYFRPGEDILVHNVDIFSDVDLRALYESHVASGALATLAVRSPRTPRYLLFDNTGALCGYGNSTTGYEQVVCEPKGGKEPERVDFCGIQAISPRLFERITETGVFSIMTTYMRLASAGEKIQPYRVDGSRWIDVGSHESLEEARRMFGTNR